MELDRQAVQLQHTRTQAAAEVRAGAEQEAAQRTQTAGAAQALAASNDALIAERAGLETDRDDHREAARAQASAHSFAGSVANQLELVRHERTRLSTKATQYTEQLASLDIELEVLQRGEQDILTRKAAAWDEVLELNRQRDHWRRQAEGAKDLLAQLRAQRTGLANRVEVLEGLERSLEGLGTGVREVVALLESEKAVRTLVVGLVADVLTVPRDVAPLIDIALGEAAQRFVVRDELKLDGWLRQRTAPLAGRVGFVPLREVGRSGDELGPAGAFAAFLAEHGAERAAASVRCADAALMGVPEQLLGRTLIVPDLATARVMRSAEARFEAGPCRYVTRQGELLDDDGTLTVGTHRAETGILSRKSELRELRERLQPLDERIQATEQHYDACRSSADALDAPLQALQAKIEVLTEEAGAQRSRIGTHRSNREGLHQDLASNRTALVDYDREVQQLEDKYAAAQRQAALTDERVALLEARLEQANHTIRRLEAEREARQTASTAAQVALAQAVERLAGLHARLEQVEAEQRTLDKQRAECADQQDELGDRLRTCELAALTGSAELAAAYARKETAERALASAAGERQLARARRQHLATQIAQVRSAWQEQHQAAAATELEVNALTLRRASVAERLREDYQLDLAAEYERVGGVVPEVPTEATSEIDELRRKLSRLGSVNLESLQELIEVETRAKELATQYDDLSKSQKALQDIINTINTDSRKLFSETFETVRRHFQDLFRKLFAGGMADVILEDETDVLESGIEVVARPPGKELRSISLMSGGEKTMTAVALLLAIFRNRPSPFCLLDEVDAALDEANTARLANVLREFLDRSHFIVITHKKRTMAAADVLYGITMAESGVSKQFSVRFEDWPDDQPAAAAA
jgi:chromosome segregation protein